MIGTPVKIGKLDVTWRGFQPEMTLTDVALVDSYGGSELLQLDQLRVSVDPRKTLFAGDLKIKNLSFDGVQLFLQRDANGQFAVRGLRSQSSPSEQSHKGAADTLRLLLLAENIELNNSSVVLFDEMRDIEYYFPYANIIVKNRDGRHQAHAQLALPPSLGDIIEVNIDFSGDLNVSKSLIGQVHISGRALQLNEWTKHIPNLPIQLPSGVADIALWSGWSEEKMQWTRLIVGISDFSTLGASIGMSHDSSIKPWTVDKFNADFHWQRDPSGWDLAISDILIRRNSATWPHNAVRVWQQRDANDVVTLFGAGRFIPIEDSFSLGLALLGDRVAVPPINQLRDMQATGEVKDWRFEFIPSQGLKGLKIKAHIQDIGFSSSDKLPSVSGINAAVTGVGQQLQVEIKSRDLRFEVPSVFRRPIQLDSLAGQLNLAWQGQRLTVDSEQISASNADISVTARFLAGVDEEGEVHLDLRSNFQDGYGAHASHYLPVGIMEDSLIEWLDQAIVNGTIEYGSLLIRGELSDFPFAQNNGVFDVDFSVRDVQLDYAEGWPMAYDASGQVRFFADSLSVRVDKGRVFDTPLDELTATVDTFNTTVLKVQAGLTADVATLLAFATTGPLANIFAGAIDRLSGQGSAGVSMNLALPLSQDNPDPLTVSGDISLSDTWFYSPEIDTRFDHVVGTIHYNEQGAEANNIRAVAMGVPLRVDVVSLPHDDTRSKAMRELADGFVTAPPRDIKITASARMEATDLLRKLEIPLDNYISGQSDWRVVTTLLAASQQGGTGSASLDIFSDLKGTQISLPLPLYKSVAQAKNFHLKVPLSGDNALKHWFLDYGDIVNVAVDESLNLVAEFGGAVATLPTEQGIYLRGHTESIDYDGWQATILGLLGHYLPKGDDHRDSPKLFADIQVGYLFALNRYLKEVQIAFDSHPQAGLLSVDSDTLRADIAMPYPWLGLENVVDLDVEHFDFDHWQNTQAVALPESEEPLKPAQIPPFSLHIDGLIAFNYYLKNVQLSVHHTLSGMALSSISFDNQALTMRGEGLWDYNAKTQEHYTRLDMMLSTVSAGDAMLELGQEPILSGGSGTLDVAIEWPRALYQPKLAQLRGEVDFELKEGYILSVNPGLGRLIGLFAIQELPRRLMFDFSDTVSDNLQFHKIVGSLSLMDGLAHARDMNIYASLGEIRVKGYSDYVNKTYNARFRVLPRLFASLPLVSAAVGGFASGVMVFLGYNFFDQLDISLDNIGRTKYTMTGSWDNPIVNECKDERNIFCEK